MRIERDFLGERPVPAGAYYGIHAARAAENFAISGRSLARSLIRALALVKKAAALAHQKVSGWPVEVAEAVARAADELAAGDLDAEIIVDPLQGGAGTAANMNVNEVIANRANQLLGRPLGSYDPVHPLQTVNQGQSTNDVFPTAVRIAAIWEMRELTSEVARLQEGLQAKETEFAGILKIARTQLQDAVPITLGAEFGAWAEAISRDRWRLYRVEERLRVVNLGGTAIGTGIATSRAFQNEVIRSLRHETGLGLARADNLIEATQNADVLVEASGLLKPLGVNLGKMASDLRLLSSGPHAGLGEIRLPAVQEGSSIMPGKVNPVMCEMLNQAVMRVFGNDQVITQAAAAGQLELNAFLPLIVDSLLDSTTLLRRAIAAFHDRCLRGITANPERCRAHLEGSLGLLTVLADRLGHEAMSDIYLAHQKSGRPVSELLIEAGLVTAAEIAEAIAAFRARP
jgi:aspartate ammonia-lyase